MTDTADCACPINAAGDIRCHKCGEYVNVRCWKCWTPRGEGPCPHQGVESRCAVCGCVDADHMPDGFCTGRCCSSANCRRQEGGSAAARRRISYSLCVCGHVQAHHKPSANPNTYGDDCRWGGCGCPMFLGARRFESRA